MANAKKSGEGKIWLNKGAADDKAKRITGKYELDINGKHCNRNLYSKTAKALRHPH